MKTMGLVGLWLTVFAGSIKSSAQIPATDSLGWVSLRSDSATGPMAVRRTTRPDSASGEILLQDIEIKGNVEKPGVVVLPKRLEPETEGMDLDRDFEKELKKGTSEVPKPEEELQRVERVESIKKAINKKRK